MMNSESRAWGFLFAFLAAIVPAVTHNWESGIFPALVAINFWLAGVGEYIVQKVVNHFEATR